MALTAKAPRHKGLTVKQVSDREFNVECSSKSHGFFHRVIHSISTGNWICSSDCWEFRRHSRCPHTIAAQIHANGGRPIVARTAFDLWDGDEIEPEQPKPKTQLEDLWRDA